MLCPAINEEFCRRLVIEASQAGAIVVGDEGMEVGVAFGVVEKAAVVGGTVLRHPAQMLAEAPVEALDHAVGLRPEGLGEAVGDGALAGAGSGPQIIKDVNFSRPPEIAATLAFRRRHFAPIPKTRRRRPRRGRFAMRHNSKISRRHGD